MIDRNQIMGNIASSITASKSPDAQIVAVLDEGLIIAGSKVTGKVYLNILGYETPFNSIDLRIIGQEYTTARYHVQTGHGKHHRRVLKIANTFYNFLDINLPLTRFPNSIQKGNYEFPFSFIVPLNAPSSIQIGSQESCSIVYKLCSILKQTVVSQSTVNSSIIFKVQSHIRNELKVPYYIEPHSEVITSWFCMSSGNILIGIRIEYLAVSAGDTFFVQYAIKNNSNAKINSVEVVLEENIYFYADRASSHGELSDMMNYLRFKNELPNSNSNSCLRHIRHILSNGRVNINQDNIDFTPITKLSAIADEFQEFQNLKDILDFDRNKIQITVPTNANPSYNGFLMNCKHTLSVKVNTTFGASDPIVNAPIQIFIRNGSNNNYNQGAMMINNNVNNQDNMMVPTALPSNWSPIIAQQVIIPSFATTSGSISSNNNAAMLEHDDHNHTVAYAVFGDSIDTIIHLNTTALLQRITNHSDPCHLLEIWLSGNNNSADQFIPMQYYQMFQSIHNNSNIEQCRCSYILSKSLSMIGCEMLAMAAKGSTVQSKADVVRQLVSTIPIADKQNSKLVQSELSAFQWLTVEQYFK